VWETEPQGQSEADGHGLALYLRFEKVITLTEVRQIESDSANADRYLALLDHARNGMTTLADHAFLTANCSKHTIGDAAFEARFPEDDLSIAYIFTTNLEVDQCNTRQLNKMQQKMLKKITKIQAKNVG
jgi:hypothetical protein